MHTLTQVWVFFIALTFSFLFLGFQLMGRIGLFVAFLISLIIVYATLHRGLKLFKKKLAAKLFCGNDPSGFLSTIENNKAQFGFKKIGVYQTAHNTPPLIWKSKPGEAHLVLNSNLLNNLNAEEIRLLALFLLSHLENRSFLVTPVLSVINQSFYNFNIFSLVLSSVVVLIFGLQKQILKSDAKFKRVSKTSNQVSAYELSFFINKLHNFEFNQNKIRIGTEYFSVLSFKKNNFFNQYGIPNLNLRLKTIIGYTI